jgi:ABC-2 type transport system ATP-binding protein
MIENPEFFGNLTGVKNLEYCASLNNLKLDMEEVNNYAGELELFDDLNKKVKTYSVGMKKKLDFIQAIIGGTEIVILDEPMSGVDPYIIPRMRNIIKRKADEGVAFLIATHQLSEAVKVCDRITMINKGEIKVNLKLDDNVSDLYLEELFVKVVEGIV